MTQAEQQTPADRGNGLDLLIVAPGFPAHDQDDQCLPALQVLWSTLPHAMPDARLRGLSLHYPFEAGVRTWRGIRVADVGGRNRRWPLRALALLRMYRALGALTRERRPNLIHVFFLRDAALVASAFARRRGIPGVVTLVGQDSRSSNRYAQCHTGFSGLIAESERSADLFFSRTARRATVIPWGVEPFVGGLPARKDRAIDLLGVGSLSELKDFATFIRVSGALHREGRIRRAVLLGDGPERAHLESLIRALGLSTVVECRGAVSRSEVLTTMANARILLHPSRYEGFGMVFAEARSRGMSVVSRAVGAATASAAWRLCDSDSDFAQACWSQLDPDFESTGGSETLVQNTVERHAALYREVAAAWHLTHEN